MKKPCFCSERLRNPFSDLILALHMVGCKRFFAKTMANRVKFVSVYGLFIFIPPFWFQTPA